MDVTQRSYQWDNMKGVAILAVVVGHFIQPGIKSSLFLQEFFFFLYLWHMPVICFVSGVLYAYSKKTVGRRALTFIWYALLGQLLYSVVCQWIGLETTYYSLLWYLIALSVWTLIAPLILKYAQNQHRKMIVLMFSIVAGIAAGFINVESTAILTPRIVTYFPYFLLGLLGVIKGEKRTGLYSMLLLGSALALILNIETINYRTVFLNQGYEILDSGIGLGMLSRIGVYLAGLSAIILVGEWIPHSKNQLTRVGYFSLPIYLLHGIFIKMSTTLEIVDYSNFKVVLMEALALIIGIIFVVRWCQVKKVVIGLMLCITLMFGQTVYANDQVQVVTENKSDSQTLVTIDDWRATGTEVEKVSEILKKVCHEKTDTNADIEKLKLYLKNSGIESHNRSSQYNGKTHESLVVKLETGLYNLDLGHTLVNDQMMISEGFQFIYDDLLLNSPDPFKKDKSEIKKTFKYYAQSDLKWKFIDFSYKNIWSTGCGVVSTAMIYHYLTPADVTVTPADTIKIAKENKLDIKETPRVDMPKLLNLLSKKYGVDYKVLKTFDNRNLKAKELKKKVADWKTKQLVKSEIASGKIVLLSTLLNDKINYTSGVEHFLVVLAYEKGEVIVADPLPQHTFYKAPTLPFAKNLDGYVYQVPVDTLLEKMTQAYAFEHKEVQ